MQDILAKPPQAHTYIFNGIRFQPSQAHTTCFLHVSDHLFFPSESRLKLYCSPKFDMAGSVIIDRQVTIQFDNGKKQAIPKGLLEESLGKTWLRLRPTSREICNLLCGSTCKLGKNPTFVGSEVKRQAALKAHGQNELEAQESMFDEEKEVEQPKKKLRLDAAAITIDVHGTEVHVLAAAKRATLSDLQIELDPNQLSAAFLFLKPDCTKNFQGDSKVRSCQCGARRRRSWGEWTKGFPVPGATRKPMKAHV